MSTFKAAVLVKSNSPLEIRELRFPKELQPGQVLVEMDTAALCGSQLGEISAIKGVDKFLPHLLGHEGIGKVIDIGTNVSKLFPGDRVITHWMKGSGSDCLGIRYLSVDDTEINAGSIAVFSEIAIIAENRLTKFSSDLSDELISLMGCGFLTSYGVIKRDLEISSEFAGKILIIGFGGIGQMLSLFLKKMTKSKISIVEKNFDNLQKSQNFGVSNNYLNITSELIGQEFDYVIDTTGNAKLINEAYNLLTTKGTLLLVGVTPSGDKISIDPMPLHFGREVKGCFGGQANPDIDIPEIIKLLNSDPKWFLQAKGEEYTLENINAAIDNLSSGKNQGRQLIKFFK